MCKLILLVGLPGAGKSTYLDCLGATALSSDEMRRLLADDPTDQTIHTRVFGALRYLIVQRIKIGRPVTFIDATNITRKNRRPFIKLAQLHGCEAEAIYFDVPLEVCLERNRGRTRVVPDDAVRDMAARLQPPELEEGFTRVVTIFGGPVLPCKSTNPREGS